MTTQPVFKAQKPPQPLATAKTIPHLAVNAPKAHDLRQVQRDILFFIRDVRRGGNPRIAIHRLNRLYGGLNVAPAELLDELTYIWSNLQSAVQNGYRAIRSDGKLLR